jgi:rRNA-processing protein FCF1
MKLKFGSKVLVKDLDEVGQVVESHGHGVYIVATKDRRITRRRRDLEST